MTEACGCIGMMVCNRHAREDSDRIREEMQKPPTDAECENCQRSRLERVVYGTPVSLASEIERLRECLKVAVEALTQAREDVCSCNIVEGQEPHYCGQHDEIDAALARCRE